MRLDMKNNSLQFLLLSIFLASCGGGGGSSLVLTVQQFSSFSVNEDDTFQTVISSSTNKPANITYTISKPSSNANVTISNSGALFYSCLLYTSPSPRDGLLSRMPSSA